MGLNLAQVERQGIRDRMKVLSVASECVPFVKTGGLADVAGALPGALAAFGVEVRVLMPGYPAVKAALPDDAEAREPERLPGGRARLVSRTGRRHRCHGSGFAPTVRPARQSLSRTGRQGLARQPPALRRLVPRRGANRRRRDRRLAAGRRAPARLAGGPDRGVPQARPPAGAARPADDPQHRLSGPLPAGGGDAPLGLPRGGFHPGGFEYFGQVGFLKAGLVYADRISTVSPTYARELTRPEFGMGLEGVVASRRAEMHGILNGIDLEVWNPERDRAHRRALLRQGAGPQGREPLAHGPPIRPRYGRPGSRCSAWSAGSPGRRVWTCCWRSCPDCSRAARASHCSAPAIRTWRPPSRTAAADNPGRIGVVIGWDEPLSHLMQAGADAIVVPSRFEPCGLTQLYGLRYGTLPVVARTGGLADTVIDANEAALRAGVATGFQFSPRRSGRLPGGCRRPGLRRLRRQASSGRPWCAAPCAIPVGWGASAEAYATIFSELIGTDGMKAKAAATGSAGPAEPNPLGVHWDGEGANVAVFSENATAIELCLFSEDGRRETERLALPERSGSVWHGYVPGLAPGALYGLRAHGPHAPERGHRFNPNKLLLDPYARALHGRFAAERCMSRLRPRIARRRPVVLARGQRPRDAEMRGDGPRPAGAGRRAARRGPGRRP